MVVVVVEVGIRVGMIALSCWYFVCMYLVCLVI